jgi:probable rRNA maturation factor
LVCNDVLEKESAEQNKNVFDHFVHLVIHSMLHMVGYGHDEANDAILMENKEVKFLSQIGISDPYK